MKAREHAMMMRTAVNSARKRDYEINKITILNVVDYGNKLMLDKDGNVTDNKDDADQTFDSLLVTYTYRDDDDEVQYTDEVLAINIHNVPTVWEDITASGHFSSFVYKNDSRYEDASGNPLKKAGEIGWSLHGFTCSLSNEEFRQKNRRFYVDESAN